MSTNHTELPWFSNKKQISDKFDQHLQGVLEHGKNFTMYRTFGNIKGDSNPAIHSMLLQLQKRVELYGKLPPTVYIQIDGGPENANSYLLAVCELIVARRWCETIYLTRLPVGHTHEDIDAKFGQLWKKSRQQSIVSPQQYKEFLYSVFDKKHENDRRRPSFHCIDLLAVPDYKSYFGEVGGDYINKFEGWTKGESSQLAFKFEAVDIDKSYFPLGVSSELHFNYYDLIIISILLLYTTTRCAQCTERMQATLCMN